MSSGCRMKLFSNASPAIPPAAATGTASRMISGSTKFRNSTTIRRKITPSAIITFACMASHVAFSALAAPLSEMLTPASLACGRISAISWVSMISTAFSSGRASVGRRRSEIACLPLIRRICCGALIISISASCPSFNTEPERVTTGISPSSAAVSLLASLPATTRSINSPAIGIWMTLAPSLNTSTAEVTSRTETPARASAARSGVIRICGAPLSRLGSART